MTQEQAIIYLIVFGVGVLISLVAYVHHVISTRRSVRAQLAESERKAKAEAKDELRRLRVIRSHYDQIRSCVEKELHKSWHPNMECRWFLDTDFHKPVKEALEALRGEKGALANFKFLPEPAGGL